MKTYEFWIPIIIFGAFFLLLSLVLGVILAISDRRKRRKKYPRLTWGDKLDR